MNKETYLRYKKKIGRRVYVRRISCPDYLLAGTLADIDMHSDKLIIESDNDSYIVDYDDILSLDIKKPNISDIQTNGVSR